MGLYTDNDKNTSVYREGCK